MAPVSVRLPRFPRLLWLVLLSCIREESPRRRLPAGRLAGMMSPPRALSVEDEELGIDVSPEVRAATAPDAELAGVELAPGTGHRLHGAEGDCLQVEAESEVRDAASVALTLCRSPGRRGTDHSSPGTGTSRSCGCTAPAPV